MAGLFDSLTIGASGLQAQQRAAQIIGANIANYGTEGYHREDPYFTSNSAFSGVQIATLTRASQKYLEHNLNAASANQEYTYTRAMALKPMQSSIATLTDQGLGARLDNVFKSLNAFASNVTQTAPRTVVLSDLTLFANTVNDDAQNIYDQQKSLDAQVIANVANINAQSKIVAGLNTAIISAVAAGDPAANLMDQRDLAVGTLASIAGATVSVQSSGEYTVLIGDSITLASGGQYNTLTTQVNATTGFHNVVMPNTSFGALDSRITGGSLGANLYVRDNDLATAATELDQLAYDIATAFNTQHTAGFDLTGTAGINLFTPPTVVAGSALGLTLNPAIVGKPALLAGALTAVVGTTGDNQNALLLAGLQYVNNASGNTQTMFQAISTLVSVVGSNAEQANSFHQTAYAQKIVAQNLWQQNSGINREEQIIRLTEYQVAHTAAVRFITTVDQMLESLMSL